MCPSPSFNVISNSENLLYRGLPRLLKHLVRVLTEVQVPGAAFGLWLVVEGMKAQLLQIQNNFEAELRDASSPVDLGESSHPWDFPVVQLPSICSASPTPFLASSWEYHLFKIGTHCCLGFTSEERNLPQQSRTDALTQRPASTLASVRGSTFSC